MKIKTRSFLPFFLIIIILISGCVSAVKKHEDTPSMLTLLTNKAQIAVEDGYFEEGGEQAVLEDVSKKNPNVYNWFIERGYEIRVGVVIGYAVVMVCDKGNPVFEDTYCNGGDPDKDHRGNPNLKSCEITMTIEDVKKFCQ